jgi:hypothetical protein
MENITLVRHRGLDPRSKNKEDVADIFFENSSMTAYIEAN